jgi:hypothetical protein
MWNQTLAINPADPEINLPELFKKVMRSKKLNKTSFSTLLTGYLEKIYSSKNRAPGLILAQVALVNADMLEIRTQTNSIASFIVGMQAMGCNVNVNITNI